MSVVPKKIVIKSGAKTAQVSLPLTQKSPAASVTQTEAAPAATPLQQKKVVAGRSEALLPAAPKKAKSQSVPKKLVFAPQEEDEAEEAPAKTRDELLMEAFALLQAALGMPAGAKGRAKGLKKDGTPRAQRTNNSGWNQFVKDFCAENPGVIWKDAMVLCKGPWAELKGESASVASAEEEATPLPQKPKSQKLVIAAKPKPTVKIAAAAPVPVLEEAEVDVEEFDWEGQTLQKNADGFCWRVDESGDQIFIGRWDAAKEKMDEKAEEPTYGSA
jgi:hypothetical protein